MRWLLLICRFCSYALLAAAVIFVFDVIFALVAPRACEMENILPSFKCVGQLGAPISFILNIPILFIYSALFALSALMGHPVPVRPLFVLLGSAFDLVLVLGFAWPIYLFWNSVLRSQKPEN
ncbi:MAG TPA: hypothetical protein VGV41_07145 [Pseudolabrys sp.]|jgi:hypothetical protein|nr:hypothetical protein [Pseudolabrys sp.]